MEFFTFLSDGLGLAVVLFFYEQQIELTILQIHWVFLFICSADGSLDVTAGLVKINKSLVGRINTLKSLVSTSSFHSALFIIQLAD